MHKYKSQIKILPILLLFLVLGGLGHAIFNFSEGPLLKILYIIGILMFLHIVFAKKYVIDKKYLLIKIAGFRNQQIPISKIKKIVKLHSRVDSGFKLNRLIISYGNNFDFDYVAPKHREDFIKNLTEINPNIELELNGGKEKEEKSPQETVTQK